jgi:hypothetical protein
VGNGHARAAAVNVFNELPLLASSADVESN